MPLETLLPGIGTIVRVVGGLIGRPARTQSGGYYNLGGANYDLAGRLAEARRVRAEQLRNLPNPADPVTPTVPVAPPNIPVPSPQPPLVTQPPAQRPPPVATPPPTLVPNTVWQPPLSRYHSALGSAASSALVEASMGAVLPTILRSIPGALRTVCVRYPRLCGGAARGGRNLPVPVPRTPPTNPRQLPVPTRPQPPARTPQGPIYGGPIPPHEGPPRVNEPRDPARRRDSRDAAGDDLSRDPVSGEQTNQASEEVVATARRGAMPWGWIIAGGLGAYALARRGSSRGGMLRRALDQVPNPVVPNPTPDDDDDDDVDGIPDGLNPLNPFYDAYLSSSSSSSSLEEQCRELRRRNRKKPRKCTKRANVAWTSGPRRGKLAGQKCLSYARK